MITPVVEENSSEINRSKNEQVFFVKTHKKPLKTPSRSEESFFKSSKKKLAELILSSTSHGLPNAVRTKHLSMRLMWIVSFIISTCACSYLIITSFLQYLEFEVITKVRVVNEFQSEFPRILICNANEFTTRYAYNFLLDFDHTSSRLSQSKLDNIDNLIEHNQKAMEFISYNFTLDQKKRLGYALNETLLSCKFSGAKCNANDFEWVYHEYNGNCFVFNSGKNIANENIPIKKLKDPGQFAGLQLELFVGIQKELENFSVSGYSGAKIFIGNNSFKTMYEDEQEILVSAGAMTNIAVQRMLVNQKEKPFSSCVLSSDSIFYKKITSLNLSYSRMDCHDLCRQKKIEDNCNCYYPRLLVISKTNPCVSEKDLLCVSEQQDSFEEDAFSNECNQLCPLECGKMIFSTVYSQLNQFSRENSKKYLKNELVISKFPNKTQITYEDLLKSIVKFNIFYDSLSLIEISEKPNFNEVDLISNMGGTFGLFLGISLLSFLELFEFIFEILFLFIEKNTYIK